MAKLKETIPHDKLCNLIGQILAGLAVPYSINPTFLGAAGLAWVELRQELNIRGWATAEKCAEAVHAALNEKGATDGD